MEVEEIQTQACKFPRVGNGTSRNMDSAKIVLKTGDHQYPEDEEDGAQHKHSMSIAAAAAAGIGLAGSGANRLRGWPNSRIIRVSRSSGGKDRHSKVLTSKGLRDRRVRLSVATAIQFYDIQDRLGCDQPSKAVEWLINAASDSIAELPSLNGPFPDTPQQFSNEKRASDGGTEQEHGFDSAEVELDGDSNFQQQQQQNQNLSLSKSACSSNSENSKGSGLSLSRSELRVNRVRARERARERTAKEKETNNQNLNPISQNSSFTELLTGAISTGNNTTTTNTTTVATTTSSPSGSSEANLFHKTTARQWSSMTMEYFNSGLLGAQISRGHPHHTSGGFPGQIQMGNHTNSLPQAMQLPSFTLSTESGGGGSHHQELPHFPFVPEHLIPVAATTGTSQPEYNLNFSISSTSSSSGLGGFNRGTLQSNSSSPSLLPHHLQRFTSPVDGPSMPFLLGTAMPVAVETNHHHHHNHHIAQLQSGIDGRLQLCYSDRTQQAGSAAASNHKGKTKNG
ncbi:uncharacterized protein J3R85_020212 [Psidium guajava]|nr:uncharacterized protein J3R85_020212 [Psidium guajava]